jgi:LysM repeat protein
VKKLTWYVHSIKGNRAVLNEDENHEYAIMSPVKATDLVLVTAVADSYTVHSVIEGDTLWAISNRYLGSGSRYQEIMTLNGLTSTVINIGQKLKIPK